MNTEMYGVKQRRSRSSVCSEYSVVKSREYRTVPLGGKRAAQDKADAESD